MSTRIKDTLVIKRLEAELERELTPAELNQIDEEGFVRLATLVELPEEYHVPTYSFPYSMMPDYSANAAYAAFAKGLSVFETGNRWVSASENRAGQEFTGDHYQDDRSDQAEHNMDEIGFFADLQDFGNEGDNE